MSTIKTRKACITNLSAICDNEDHTKNHQHAKLPPVVKSLVARYEPGCRERLPHRARVAFGKQIHFSQSIGCDVSGLKRGRAATFCLTPGRCRRVPP